VNELIDAIRAQTPIAIRHEVDPERVRRHDVREIRGSAARLREGWRPEIALEQTLADAIAWWRDELAAGP
jgi:nucleoside-diphosphate-sugar epimerase